MSRWTPEQKKRIDEIQDQIAKLAEEFRAIVKPSEEEIKELLEDVQMNPEVYTSYFEDDDLFIAENVYQEVVAREEN
jgi:phage host-nuclease inhibitor protein Gam